MSIAVGYLTREPLGYRCTVTERSDLTSLPPLHISSIKKEPTVTRNGKPVTAYDDGLAVACDYGFFSY
jgi:hypothetical protein